MLQQLYGTEFACKADTNCHLLIQISFFLDQKQENTCERAENSPNKAIKVRNYEILGSDGRMKIKNIRIEFFFLVFEKIGSVACLKQKI